MLAKTIYTFFRFTILCDILHLLFPFCQKWIFHICYTSFWCILFIFMHHFISFRGIVYFLPSGFPHSYGGIILKLLKFIFCFPQHSTVLLPRTEKCNFRYFAYNTQKRGIARLFNLSQSLYLRHASKSVINKKTVPYPTG